MTHLQSSRRVPWAFPLLALWVRAAFGTRPCVCSGSRILGEYFYSYPSVSQLCCWTLCELPFSWVKAGFRGEKLLNEGVGGGHKWSRKSKCVGLCFIRKWWQKESLFLLSDLRALKTICR